MTDRELIEDLLSALEYHTEQTRPIQFSKVAIEAAREYLRKPAQQQEPLTARELELIDGMIEVQLDHALRCDSIGNRAMADKQKAWDMERVELLRKLKAAHGIKE